MLARVSSSVVAMPGDTSLPERMVLGALGGHACFSRLWVLQSCFGCSGRMRRGRTVWPGCVPAGEMERSKRVRNGWEGRGVLCFLGQGCWRCGVRRSVDGIHAHTIASIGRPSLFVCLFKHQTPTPYSCWLIHSATTKHGIIYLSLYTHAGMGAATCCHPLDVIRVQMQVCL